jgi:chorismate mutase
MRLFALRGAISVDRNGASEIHEATTALMEEIMQRNSLAPRDVVSCIFTATEDLDADFPAAAARSIGFEGVPLLCAREMVVPAAMPRVIRVLIHYYAEDGHEARHVYLRDAVALRSDLQAAQ